MVKFAAVLQVVGLALLFIGELSDDPGPFLAAAISPLMLATAFVLRWLIEDRPGLED